MPPAFATVPSAKTTVEPMTKSRGRPNVARRGPDQPEASNPPTLLNPGDGASSGTNWPRSASVALRRSTLRPHSTEIVRSRNSYSSTLSSRAVEIAILYRAGEKPMPCSVPPPKTTTASPASLQAFTTAASSSIEAGARARSGTLPPRAKAAGSSPGAKATRRPPRASAVATAFARDCALHRTPLRSGRSSRD